MSTDTIKGTETASSANAEATKSFILGDSTNSMNCSVFIAEEDVLEFCSEELGCVADSSRLKYVINLGLLPVYKFDNRNMLLKNDLVSVLDVLCVSEMNACTRPLYDSLFEQDVIRIGPCTTIDFVHEETVGVPTFFSAVRNLISIHKNMMTPGNKTESSMQYFPGTRLATVSKKVFEFAGVQLIRDRKVNMDATSQFARSAHYMGSKRLLCGFLVEAISSVLPESGVIVDLMCGSGVTSGAFNKIWRTFASDAQEFCTTLAVIHGGGYNRTTAQGLLSRLLPIAKQHFKDLRRPLSDGIEAEDNMFFRDTDESLLKDYREFLRTFPTLPKKTSNDRWNPLAEFRRRRVDHKIYPYCLFTAYFSNVYFGLRQCVEIDSLRFSIDQLENKNDKKWALGALIATVSALGTTYGGHFAQPRVRNESDVNLTNLSKIIDKRSSSITHEFTVRLLNLSEQSEDSSRAIEIVHGPWKNALSTLDDELESEAVLVYLDAPYKREEYSRFYHVLETLVSYTYPSCAGTGLTPKTSDRFRSEFFTRDEDQLRAALVSVITDVLQRGWSCAWSYSDSAAASIYEVISSVCRREACNVISYSAPFEHKSHGGARPKSVTEYLNMFTPMK